MRTVVSAFPLGVWRAERCHQPGPTRVATVTENDALTAAPVKLLGEATLRKHAGIVDTARPLGNHTADARRGVHNQLYVDGVVQMPVDVHLFMLRWGLDPDVCAVNGTHDTRETVHGIERLLKLQHLRRVRPPAARSRMLTETIFTLLSYNIVLETNGSILRTHEHEIVRFVIFLTQGPTNASKAYHSFQHHHGGANSYISVRSGSVPLRPPVNSADYEWHQLRKVSFAVLELR